jgi:hypothetical protein
MNPPEQKAKFSADEARQRFEAALRGARIAGPKHKQSVTPKRRKSKRKKQQKTKSK